MTSNAPKLSIVERTSKYLGQAESLGALAHDAYWLVHHDVTGALKGSRRAADRIIAASTLAELLELDAIKVEPDRVVANKGRSVADDRLLAAVRDQLLEAPRLSPVDVIDALASDIRGRVAERLITSGLAVTRRSGFRRVTVRREGDLAPASVEADLINSVVSGHRLTNHQRFLLTLLHHASGAGFLHTTFTPIMSKQVFTPDLIERAFTHEQAAAAQYGCLAEAACISLRLIAAA
ncbi:GPP34 family phosphoprotein [Couchioplanes caeruleus]|uniref:GPP34 family phosphoprotein n=1 Tax=Couchioplanes caeruleus TaxID=56438 RepID=UPI0020BEBB5E|nr:GPP34 family phosphoprotein [Couchioplanes caeruleus]UQU67418.1 GPP34 family phosphoprotein [Couchioplanes caeruleus]